MKKVLFVLLFVSLSIAKESSNKKVYHATRVNPHPPLIDGRGDDMIWQKAVRATDFIQYEPNNGAAPSQKTCFQIAYDDQDLYVLIRACDTEADKIVGRVSRRDDQAQSDRVGILIDSYHDLRTAFEFTVDAAGSKTDLIHSNDGDNEDTSWDPIWYVKTSKDDSGWTAEMRIPFSQLRFANKEEQVWGLEVFRDLHRKKEMSLWQHIPKDASGLVHEFGALQGIRNIDMPHRIELLPYSVSSLQTTKREPDNPFATGRKETMSGGLDGKIGLSSDLTMDFTVNPDFGQVEADPSEVNLTAFESYFEEKRPFFVEGKNIFDYRLMIGDGDLAQDMLFYSRRIGRSPQHELDLDDDEHADAPQNTSIRGAAKVSGKTANGWSIGMIDAATQEERAEISRQGSRQSETVEPAANYWVGRLQKDFGQGRTSVGGLFTAANRRINDPQLNYLNRSAYTGGLDLRHTWHNREYLLDIRTAFSHIRGHRDAMLDLQTSSAHYFQRPDAGYVQVDSSANSITGNGGFATIGKAGGGHFQYLLAGFWRSPGLDLNDIGFMRRADQIMELFWVGYRYWTPKWIFRKINLNADQWRMWNYGRDILGAGIESGINVQFTNYWNAGLGFNRQSENLDMSALRGGPALKSPGQTGLWWNVSSDGRKPWQLFLRGNDSRNDDGISRYDNLSVGLTLKPNKTFTLTLEPSYRQTVDDLQYVDTVGSDQAPRYVMARLDQKILAFVFRFDFCLTPTLSIQYYGQPFVAAGAYRRYKCITQPRAVTYADRFHTFSTGEIRYDADDEIYSIDENGDGRTDYTFEKPDFNFKQFRSNLVVRWEYQPGSTFYLVWAQGRTGSRSIGRFSLGRDMRDLYNLYPENVILIKFNHWFSL